MITIEPTVLMEPIVSSTISPASLYDARPWLDILDSIFATVPAAATNGGIVESITRVRSQPLINASTNPPKKVVTSCRNLPA
jgi:hypothetical protein